MEPQNLIQQLYLAYYGRPADPGGLTYWVEQLQANDGNLDSIINFFGDSDEFTQRHGDQEPTELINNLYQQLFGRDAEEGGLEFYTEKLESGELTLAQIASTISQNAANEDSTTVNNRVEVANRFTQDVQERGLAYGPDQIEAAGQLVAGVASNTNVAEYIQSAVNQMLDTLPAADNAGPGNGEDTEENTGGGGSAGGGGDTFTAAVSDTTGVVTFGGTASGDISVEWSDVAGDSVATFSRGGVPATTKPDFSNTGGKATKISVEAGQTLAATAADLAGVTVEGEGAVNVTALESTLDADLSNLDATTVNAAFAGGAPATFTGDVGNAAVTVSGTGTEMVIDPAATIGATAAFTVETGNTLSGTAAKLDGVAAPGAGTVDVTALEGMLDADLSSLTTTAVNAAVSTDSATPVNFVGNFGEAAVTTSGNGILNVDGATMGTATFSVITGTTLQGTAAKLDGVAASGAGTVDVTALEGTLGADLSSLTATTVNAAVSTDSGTPVNFVGNFGKAAVTTSGNGILNVDGATMETATFSVVDTTILQGTASKLDGVAVLGAGTVNVTALESSLGADLSSIEIATTLELTDKVAFEGKFHPVPQVTVDGGFELDITGVAVEDLPASMVLANNATLKLTAAQADGFGITGTGNVLVTELENTPEVDLSSIDVTNLEVTVAADTSITLGGSAGLNGADVTLGNNASLTGTEAQIGGLTITEEGANGTVTVTDIGLDVNLTDITVTNLNATVANSVVLSGNADLNDAAVELQAGASLTGTYAEIGNLTITEATETGTVKVTEIVAGVDLGSITVSTLEAEVAGDLTLAGSANLNDAAVTIENSGKLDVTSVTTLNASSFTVAADATLKLTAKQAAAIGTNGDGITGNGTVIISGLDAFAGDIGGLTAAGLSVMLEGSDNVQNPHAPTANSNLADRAYQIEGHLSLEDVVAIPSDLTINQDASLALIGEKAANVGTNGAGLKGGGDLVVSDVQASDPNLSGIAVSGTVTAQADTGSAPVTLESTTNLSTVDTLEVAGNSTLAIADTATLGAELIISVDSTATVSLSGAHASEVAGIEGDGAVEVTALGATAGETIGLESIAGVTTLGFDASPLTGESEAASITGFSAGASADVIDLDALSGITASSLAFNDGAGPGVIATNTLLVVASDDTAYAANATTLTAELNGTETAIADIEAGWDTDSGDMSSSVYVFAVGNTANDSFKLYTATGTSESNGDFAGVELIGTVGTSELLTADNFVSA